MTNIENHIALFFIPMIIGNITHMIVVKLDLFAFLNSPISGKLFGENKTWRGFVYLPIASAILAILGNKLILNNELLDLRVFIFGLGLGFFYMLSELPNSFVKRRMGLGSGESSKKYKVLQIFIDKSDSLIGILLYYKIVTGTSFSVLLLLFLISICIHFSLSFLLFKLKIKTSL